MHQKRIAISLRPYQKDCIKASIQSFKNHQRIAVSLPVGSGKTVIFSNLISKIPKPFEKARKTLVLAHRKELIIQAYKQIKRFAPELNVCVDQGSLKLDPLADVVVASVSTIGRANTPRILGYDPEEFKCVIIDEAHHAAASSYQRILKHLNVYNDSSHIKVWGCSATLRRHDGLSLQPTFQEIVFEKPVKEMIDDKWLCDLEINTVQTKLVLGKIPSQANDYQLKELSRKCNTVERNQILLMTYQEHSQKASRKSTLIFAVDVQHILDIVDTFKSAGIDAYGIHATTDAKDRESIIDRFRRREIPVLVNCGILTEGVDIPCIDMLLMARPTKSGVLLQQMLGRGMRLYEGKEYCLVLDFVDVIDSGMMQATIPTLLGLDSRCTLKKASLKETLAKDDDQKDELPPPQEDDENEKWFNDDSNENVEVQVTLVRHLDPFSIHAIDNEQKFIRKFSSLSWTRVGPESFVLNLNQRNYMTLAYEKTTKSWKGTLKEIVRSKQDKMYHKLVYNVLEDGTSVPFELCQDNFCDAIKGMDLIVKSRFGYSSFQRLSWTSSWRRLEITDGQRKFLAKIGIHNVNERGIASDLISKRVHGAKGKYEKQQRNKEKLEKLAKRQDSRW